jgi:D-arabinose 1-dehydrogenase-like Zn-dependent alcohol dehydrogenase
MSGLRPEGRLVVMGVQEEDMVLPEKLVFPQMIANRRKIIASQHNGREVQHEALQIAAASKVKVITEEYKFTEVGRAVQRVAEGKTRFRAVLVNAN